MNARASTDQRLVTKQNRLNELSGKEWIKFTKSWFVQNPQPRGLKLIHPASFPETLVAQFVQFFTKRGQWILDPFLGTGSSLIAARITARNGVGVELYPEYSKYAQKWLKSIAPSGMKQIVVNGNSLELQTIFNKFDFPNMDFCITSPPYWNQLSLSHRRQRNRTLRGLATSYGHSNDDLGNIENYYDFLERQSTIFDNVFEVMKEGAYLVVFTNNVYRHKRLYPLAFDTFRYLSNKWVPKDEKIWCQDNKPLFPFGIFDTWIGNRAHHYCLIFRKEKS